MLSPLMESPSTSTPLMNRNKSTSQNTGSIRSLNLEMTRSDSHNNYKNNNNNNNNKKKGEEHRIPMMQNYLSTSMQSSSSSQLPPPPPLVYRTKIRPTSTSSHIGTGTGTGMPPLLPPPPSPRRRQSKPPSPSEPSSSASSLPPPEQEQEQRRPLNPIQTKKKKRRPIRKLVKLLRRSSSSRHYNNHNPSSSTTSLLSLGTTIDLNSIGTMEFDSQSEGGLGLEWEEGDLDYSYLEYENYQRSSHDVVLRTKPVEDGGVNVDREDAAVPVVVDDGGGADAATTTAATTATTTPIAAATTPAVTTTPSNEVEESKTNRVVSNVVNSKEHETTAPTQSSTVDTDTQPLEQEETLKNIDSSLQPAQDTKTTTSIAPHENKPTSERITTTTEIQSSPKSEIEQSIKDGKYHYRQGLYNQALQIQRSALASLEQDNDDDNDTSAETAYHCALLKHDLAKTQWRLAKRDQVDNLQPLTEVVQNTKVQVWISSVRYLHGELIQIQSTTVSLLQQGADFDKEDLGHLCHHLYILHTLGSLCDKHLHQYDHAIQYYQQALDLECKVLERMEEKRQRRHVVEHGGVDLKELKQWSMRVRTTRKKLGAIHYITGRFDLALASSFSSNVST